MTPMTQIYVYAWNERVCVCHYKITKLIYSQALQLTAVCLCSEFYRSVVPLSLSFKLHTYTYLLTIYVQFESCAHCRMEYFGKYGVCMMESK